MLRKTWSCTALALTVIAALLAAPAHAQNRVPADAATTGQKAKLVENLVTKSVSATRIEESGDATARSALAEARGLVAAAKSDLGEGAVETANQKLDQALALVNGEIRRLSGAEVRGAHDREMYQRRLTAVNTFLAAYQRVAEGGSSRSAAKQAEILNDLVGKAEAEAGQGRYDEANEILNDAYVTARGDIREMRQGQTLTRALEFASPEEEYDYELGRNESHFLLLKFAMTENTPVGSVVDRISENRTAAEKLRAEAENKAAAGGFSDAIGLLNQSTELLLQSIRMSGIFIPG